MLFSLSAGLLGETQLTRDLVFGRKRAQFVPGRVLDLDADLATFLLPQIFDLARIEHAVIEIGLVPSRGSLPPKGATCFGERPESAVASPIMPSRIAISGYAASRPTWLCRNTVQAATFAVF